MALNNWFVITGAPSAGKTTLIKLLEEKGYRVFFEAARLYIDQEIQKGRTLEDIRRDEIIFQKEILKMKIEVEKNLPQEEIIFFDRGIPDSYAYYKLRGAHNDEFLLESMKKCSYKSVFLLDFFDYEKDYARIETKEEQMKIHDLLEKSYLILNIPVIKVPKMPIEERLKFILKKI